MNRTAALLTAWTLSLLAVASACSSDDAADEPEQESLVTVDVGAGWMLELPEDWIVDGTFGDPIEPASGCVVDQLSIAHGTERTQVALVGPGCSADAVGRGNGQPPTFGSVDQLVDGASDLDRSDTPIGTLTIATVEYFECTNECIDYNPTIGLIELNNPADSSIATVVISNDRGSTSRSVIEFIARHLTRG